MYKRLILAAVLVLSVSGVATAAGVFSAEQAELTLHQRIHEGKENRPFFPLNVPDERLSDVACTEDAAGPFECDGVDLLSFVPFSEFGPIRAGTLGVSLGGLSDIWGWTDPETDEEYVMVGKTHGVAFFNITDPTDPLYLGDLPNTAAAQLIWHDIKVYDNHAFIVSESNPHGMTVFDLTRLRGVTEAQTWTRDGFYPLPSAVHNIAINEDTGYAYLVGGNAGIVVPDHCRSGLHMVDISNPGLPLFAGCYMDPDAGGGPGGLGTYVHDTQCVLYHGPDERYEGQELCFNSNEVTVTIADVTDKANPVQVGSASYPHVAYTHQGWLSEDHRYFLVGDELDEQRSNAVNTTRTLVFDVTDLENPVLHFEHFHETRSIDHNMYTHEGLVYQSNYTAGLRVLDLSRIAERELTEVAFFDTFPANDNPTFNGTWSNYPYFASGTIAVTGVDEGLFLLRVQDEVFEELRAADADG